LKIFAQSASRRELDVLLRLRDRLLGNEDIVELLDHFELVGTNGQHLCLVLELMWQDTQEFMNGVFDAKARISVARRMSSQILRGINGLHLCGITHNGQFSRSCSNSS